MARSFNGSSDYISAAGSAGNSAPITMACWVRQATVTGGTPQFVAQGSDTETARLRLGRSNIGLATFGVFNSANLNRICTATSSMFANTWAHLCGKHISGSETELYFNGALESTNSGRSLSTQAKIVIGADYVSGALSSYAAADIAEVALWNANLTAAEIASLAKGFSPRRIRPQALAFYAPLTREIRDLRNAFSLTTSGTAVADHPRIYA